MVSIKPIFKNNPLLNWDLLWSHQTRPHDNSGLIYVIIIIEAQIAGKFISNLVIAYW